MYLVSLIKGAVRTELGMKKKGLGIDSMQTKFYYPIGYELGWFVFEISKRVLSNHLIYLNSTAYVDSPLFAKLIWFSNCL
jgi:hypothetical protein